jgi:hypothetical protein
LTLSSKDFPTLPHCENEKCEYCINSNSAVFVRYVRGGVGRKTQSTKYIVQSVPTDPAVNVHIHTFINFQQKLLTALGKSKEFFHCSPMLGLPNAALKGMFSFVRM